MSCPSSTRHPVTIPQMPQSKRLSPYKDPQALSSTPIWFGPSLSLFSRYFPSPSLHSSHTGLLAVSGTFQAYSSLQAFAPAVSSGWDTLPTAWLPSLPLPHCFQISPCHWTRGLILQITSSFCGGPNGRFIGTDWKIPDWPIKTTFLEEVETD